MIRPQLPPAPHVQHVAPGLVLIRTARNGYALDRLCEVDEAVSLMELLGWPAELIALALRRGQERVVRWWN